MRPGRATSVAAVAALLAAGVAWPGPATAAASPGFPTCDRAGFEVDGEWTVVSVPDFPVGPNQLRILEIGPEVAPVVYVSNGLAILRSHDGGCVWSPAFQVPGALRAPADAPVQPETTSQIVAVRAGASGRVVAVVNERTATTAPLTGARPGVRPLVATSEDYGSSWAQGAEGLPPLVAEPGPANTCGFPSTCHLDVSPVDSNVVFYASTIPGDAPATQVSRSEDGGASWEQVGRWANDGPVQQLHADPTKASRAWVVHDQIDLVDDGIAPPGGGREVAGPISGFSVTIDADGGTNLFGVGVAARDRPSEVTRVLRAQPADQQLKPYGTPGGMAGLHGFSFDALARATSRRGVVTGGSGPRVLDPVRGVYSPVSAPARLQLTSVRAERGPAGCFWFQATERVARFCPPPEQPQKPDPVKVADPFADCATPVKPPASEPATFTVDAALEVPPGGSADLQSVLDLPARPTPVDVFFLVDTSGSMEPMIASMRDSIRHAAVALTKDDIDLHVGLAEQNDTSMQYRRLVDLRPLDCTLIQALADIRTAGGWETHLTALYQAVTGAGSEPARIPVGEGASFRPGAIHIVVQATDEPYQDVPHAPSREQVAEAFVSRGIKHVGLAVGQYSVSLGEVVAPSSWDLDDTARRTGTLAPYGGIDCEGNGSVDLLEGEPLTCPFMEQSVSLQEDATHRAEAGTVVEQVVSALRGPSPVAIEVADARGLIVDLQGASTATDLTYPSTLLARGTVRCPDALLGKTVVLDLRARAGATIVGKRSVQVACHQTPPPPRVAYQPRPRAMLAAVVPPPVPVPAPSAATATQANPGSQAVGAPAAGIVPDEEEQIQVATEHAFSRRSTGPQLVPVLAATTLGLGLVVQRRRRQQQAAYAAAGSPAWAPPGRSSVAARRGRARW